jgi:hypothetical protein
LEGQIHGWDLIIVALWMSGEETSRRLGGAGETVIVRPDAPVLFGVGGAFAGLVELISRKAAVHVTGIGRRENSPPRNVASRH